MDMCQSPFITMDLRKSEFVLAKLGQPGGQRGMGWMQRETFWVGGEQVQA